MSYRLQFNENLANGVPRIVLEQVDRAVVDLTGPDTELPEAVHQLRKRCKKIRGLLRLVRGSFAGSYTQENTWFRDLARRLSYARDTEAMLECLDKLCEAFSRDLEADAFATVRHALMARRTAVQDDAELLKQVQEVVTQLQRVRAHVLGWRLDRGGFSALEPGLLQTYRRARKALRAAYEQPTSERFHEWRKRVKYHWYHLRLLHELWPAPMKVLAAETKQLADQLGDDHDLAVLCETLAHESEVMGEKYEVDALQVLAARRQGQLRAEAQTRAWRLFTERPKFFRRRLRAYWYAAECEAVRVAGQAGEREFKCSPDNNYFRSH